MLPRLTAFAIALCLAVLAGAAAAEDMDDCKQGAATFALKGCTSWLAREKEPDARATAFHRRGYVYEMVGEYNRSLLDLNQAIELNPNNAGWYIDRALLYFLKEDFGAALADGNRAVAMEPSRAAYQARGFISYYSRDFANAAADLARVLEMQPDDPNSVIHRYLAKARLGENARPRTSGQCGAAYGSRFPLCGGWAVSGDGEPGCVDRAGRCGGRLPVPLLHRRAEPASEQAGGGGILVPAGRRTVRRGFRPVVVGGGARGAERAWALGVGHSPSWRAWFPRPQRPKPEIGFGNVLGRLSFSSLLRTGGPSRQTQIFVHGYFPISIFRSYRRRHAAPMFRLRRTSDAAATPTLGVSFQKECLFRPTAASQP